MQTRQVPNFGLYGELLYGSENDPVHHEAIRERSSQHDWTIRTHRHDRLAQVFCFRTPGVAVRLAELEHQSTEPMILVIPPGIPHGFRFPEDVIGDVITLRWDALGADARARLEQFRAFGGGLLPKSEMPYFQEVALLSEQLKAAYHRPDAERGALLVSITQLILTYLAAARKRQNPGPGALGLSELTAHQKQAERFCELVEQCFARPLSVADYAREIGVSAPHLTRICRNNLDASPNALVRQRRLLEAKRLLEYTRLPVSEIAHRAGFRDPAFFSRTFKSMTGKAPLVYREDAA